MPTTKTDREVIQAAAAIVRDAVAALPALVIATKAVKCARCKGTGGLAAFAHIDGGRCMACQGNRVRIVDANKAAANAARRAANLAEIVARGKAHAAAVALLEGHTGLWVDSARAEHQRKLETLRAQYVTARAA